MELSSVQVLKKVRAVVGCRDRMTSKERARANKVLACLRDRGMTDLVRTSHRLHSLSTYWALLDRSHELRFDDPPQMVDLALLATLVANGLDPQRYGCEQIADLKARALIELGNAYRANDLLDEAQVTLGEAAERMRDGTGDPSLLIRFSDVHASLLAAKRQFSSAIEALEAVYEARLRAGDQHLAGRALVKQGLFLDYNRETMKALSVLRRGLSLVNREQDPELFFVGLHNVARCMMALGQARQARSLLWSNVQHHQESIGRVTSLKMRWLRAQIDSQLGELDKAQQGFLDVKQGFRELGLRYKQALVTLELAGLSQRGGWSTEAQAYSMEAAEVFQSLRIGSELRAAVTVFQFTLSHGVAPVALFNSLTEFLRNAEGESDLCLADWLTT